MRAGAAYRGDDEISHFEALDGRADLHDLGQRLMADHQWSSQAAGCRTQGADLFVGAADADIQQAQRDLVGLGEPGKSCSMILTC